MKPYFEKGGVVLYHGDCREVVPQLGQVDAVVTDPPYVETALGWDEAVEWLSLVRPLLVRAGSVWSFGSLKSLVPFLSRVRGAWNVAQEVVWEKHNGSGFMRDRFRRVHEFAVHLYPASVKWGEVYKLPLKTQGHERKAVRRLAKTPHTGNTAESHYDSTERLMRSVLKVRSEHGRAIHPTQKPEGIVEPLLRYSCPPGGLVLDCFAGSGTTLAVAQRLGMRAVGVEADEAYCEKAARRLEGVALEAA